MSTTPNAPDMPTPESDAAPTAPTAPTAATATGTAPTEPVVYRTDANVPLIIIGTVCILIAAMTVLSPLLHWSFSWPRLGPIGFVILGGVLATGGALALANRDRHPSR